MKISTVLCSEAIGSVTMEIMLKEIKEFKKCGRLKIVNKRACVIKIILLHLRPRLSKQNSTEGIFHIRVIMFVKGISCKTHQLPWKPNYWPALPQGTHKVYIAINESVTLQYFERVFPFLQSGTCVIKEFKTFYMSQKENFVLTFGYLSLCFGAQYCIW